MAEVTYEITMSIKDQTIVYDYLMSHIDEIIEEMWRNTVHVAYNKVKEIVKKTIDSFYSEGDTDGGGRTGDLYDVFNIGIRDGWQLIVQFGPEFMGGYHHQGADFVYENSFVRGYHGGSAGTDKNDKTVNSPHFRVPGGQWTEWGGPAPKSISPYQTIMNKFKLFNENEFKPLQYRELVRLLDQVRKRLGV